MEDHSFFKTISGVNFINSRASLHLKINKIEKVIDVFVIKNNNFSYDLILGLDAIKKFKLTQDENLNILQKINEKESELIRCQENENNVIQINHNEYKEGCYLKPDLQHLDENNRILILELIEKYKAIFAKNKYDVGRVKQEEAQIKLMENRYISKKPYRCTIPDQEEIDSQITNLLESGLIEETNSPFAAPVTLVYKKEDGCRSRLCIDFRELNKIVIPEPQPFPRIEDIMVKAGDCTWFSAFDINSAFWSIPIRQKDKKKTAFVTQNGHWQWTCLPFGLKISPSIFQRILANIIRRHNLNEFCINYIDDILIFSKSFEQHVKHIEYLLRTMKEEGFRLKMEKCNFAKNSLKYLGHIIEKNSIRPLKDNLRAIKEFEEPKNKKNVRQFLGKINFYYKYIENAAKQLEPLHNLLRKDVKFCWTAECKKAFIGMKKYLCSSPILSIYSQNKEVFIYTDASGDGLGAILKQPQENGILHPVAYFSKKLNPSQKKKKIIYLECLAIKEAIVYWQHWLIGRDFTVITDHKPLETLKVKARTDEPLGDLIYYLSQYNFKVIYAPGKENIEADSLSRNPVLENFENEEDVLKVVNMVTLEEIINDQQTNINEINDSKKVIEKGNIKFKKLKHRQRIYVSQKFGLKLIKKIHENYGHIGVSHISEHLRPYYYFKNMDTMIHQFCSACEICIKNKSRRSQQIGLLSKLGPATKPYEIMSIDSVGGFGGNKSTKKYLHILADHFTRYAFISTSKGQNARDFISLIDPVAKQYKIKIILADQYTGINSKEVKDYMKSMNITLIFTSVDCPESNGLNERLNQTLVNRIRCKINSGEKVGAWSKIAKKCTKEYNSTIHSVTKFSPAYLLYGVRPNIVPTELQENNYNLEADREKALINSTNNYEKNKKRVDNTRIDHTFQENDLVYIENGNKLNRNKLDEIRSGPLRIIKKVSNTIYEVEGTKKRRETNFYHSSKLIPVKTQVLNFNGTSLM